ncbi:hypothetical protein [Paenibacillus sp. BR1-192]|uniref:YfjL-like protein n=1 Tax=Paenibacillus sp. BR1-192 TaxID=3032287 RepID=UPI00240D1407|nr:hypothetical protein [Paenibacillus sp. BR1-192]WFB59799.1 hypothetical protein P0X86_06070 [Paenibacillus sp. BR1-192]
MKRRKRILRIGSLILAVSLIGIILFMTNELTGNPVSSRAADKAIQRHVKEHYPDLKLQVGKSKYNFKFSEYYAEAKSETSPDTVFRIYYKNGQVDYDEYDSNVLGKLNTLQRLEQEYAQAITPILAQIQGLEEPRATVMLDDPKEEAREKLTLDMPFRKDLPLNVKLAVHADMPEISLGAVADRLERVHESLLEHDYRFVEYSLSAEGDGSLISVSFVKPTDIENGQLESLLESALRANDSGDGRNENKEDMAEEPESQIHVFMKSGK